MKLNEYIYSTVKKKKSFRSNLELVVINVNLELWFELLSLKKRINVKDKWNKDSIKLYEYTFAGKKKL